MTPVEDRDTYTVKEAAAVVGISYDLLKDLIREERCPFPVVKFGPRSIRIGKAAVARFLESGQVAS